jgi:hypothetical protein
MSRVAEALRALLNNLGEAPSAEVYAVLDDATWSKAMVALALHDAQPVREPATITECEACFTPDVCQLRGTCDYYSAERIRVAATPAPDRVPLTAEQVASIVREASQGSAIRRDGTTSLRIVRAVERAHGIGR